MKTIFITGASSQIGMELLKEIAGQFECIWAHCRQVDKQLLDLQKIYGERLHFLQADFLNEQEVAAMIRQIKESGYVPSHIVHLSAPKYLIGNFPKIPWEVYEENIQVSIRSIVMILQEFLPVMAKAHFGRVIFMLSSCTVNEPPKYVSYYVMVKYALLGLMNELAKEYEAYGIMVNGISPGMVETKFLSEIPKKIVEQNAFQNPCGKNLCTKDLIDTFQFLLDSSQGITGQNITVKAV